MLYFLIVAGFVSLIFGLLFIFLPGRYWERARDLIDRPVLIIENTLHKFRFPGGFLFVAIGCWLIYLAWTDAPAWQLYFVGITFVLVGFFYLLLPDLVVWISTLSGKELIAFDKIMLSSRFSLGIMLLFVTVYIFIRVYQVLSLY